jgi:hypothetical protein
MKVADLTRLRGFVGRRVYVEWDRGGGSEVGQVSGILKGADELISIQKDANLGVILIDGERLISIQFED